MSTSKTNVSVVRRGSAVFAAVLMSTGGAVLLFPLTIDYVAQRAYWEVILLQGLGFLLVFTASLLAFGIFERTSGWAVFAAGSGLWLLCWSWFLHLGLFLPIPLVFWASLATLAYLISAFIFLINRELMSAAVVGVVAAGSIASTFVMQLVAESKVSPDYSYIPFAVGAVMGGVASAVATWWHRSSARATKSYL